jgi:diaminopimelate epimerase
MVLCFTKMHGLGNDFIVIDATTTPFALEQQQIQQLARRQTGIGFDQLLVVEPADQPNAEFRYRIFNADGGEVEHCGNGARCFARFVRDRGMTSSDEIPVSTSSGLISLRLRTDGQVTVSMGVPTFEPAEIPFQAPARADSYPLELETGDREIGAVAIGNPHAVSWVDDVDTCDIETTGPLIERHRRFPERVNSGFAQVLNRGALRLRVFERGVGETLACGTGACAAVVVGTVQGKLDSEVMVELPGGSLQVSWAGEGEQVLMTGPCETVFEGKAEL